MEINGKKLIEMTIAALYNGEPMSWTFACSRVQLKALSEALVATKSFENKLFCNESRFDEISSALKTKHAYARAFQKAFGQPWPL